MKLPGYLRRLMTEEKELKENAGIYGFYAFPRHTDNVPPDYRKWDIFIVGAQGSLYEGTVLQAEMTFPTTYPIAPPLMVFTSKMFHPNVYEDGRVCISILHDREDDFTSHESVDEKWTPVHGIRTIVLSVISMLNDPNPNSPANVDASKMFREKFEEYKKEVVRVARENDKRKRLDEILSTGN